MNRSVFSVYLLLAAMAVSSGCAPERSIYDDLYSSLTEEPAQMDWSVLEGRKIVIDPGHGGYFDGAMGADSLREADANLGVALYLWGLLEEAGASVYMTRTTDRDFLPPDSEELADDLAARMAMANSYQPEVFISIHHNSNIALDRERNRIEVYYRGEDIEASMRLAEEVHLHLARNLGIPETVIRPGSYYVLRNSTAGAAILGEASYISNPAVEDRLKIASRQKLEAEAYFLGLISYFSEGVPFIERVEPASDTLQSPSSIAFSIREGGGVPIDPPTVRISIGSKDCLPLYDPIGHMAYTAIDPALPNGQHTVRAFARSIRGGAASSAPFTFLLARPAGFILPLAPPAGGAGSGRLSLKVLDRLGMPVADGTEVLVRSLDGGSLCEGSTRGGIYSIPPAGRSTDRRFIVEAGGMNDTISFGPVEDSGLFSLNIVDAASGEPIAGARLLSGGTSFAAGDCSGTIRFPHPAEGSRIFVSAYGYIPAYVDTELLNSTSGVDTGTAIKLVRIFGGLLEGKRIAIDPAGGGDDDYGRGVNQLRGATVNWRVATQLAFALNRAGADVSFSRRGDETLSIQERIHNVNSFAPDLAVGLRFGSQLTADTGGCVIAHYPGSGNGEAISENLKLSLDGFPPCRETRLAESSELFIQQTNCPATELHSAIDPENEMLFARPGWTRAESLRIFSAILNYFSGRPGRFFHHSLKILSRQAPIEGAAVCVDQALTVITGPDGVARFDCIEPGNHVVSIAGGRFQPPVWMTFTTTEDDYGETVIEIE